MSAPDDGALPLEAMAWDGDSGGPAFIEVGGTLKIAGVNSFGFCCEYDNTDYYTRLGGISYDWIQGILNDAPISPTCSNWPSYGLDVDPRYADEVFEEFDQNEDGSLSIKECSKMYRANGDIFKEINLKKIKNMCKDADDDGDGKLSQSEYEVFIGIAEDDEEEDDGEGPNDSECGQLF